MKTLIALQLRKNLLSFAGILTALLVSVPWMLIFGAGPLKPGMALKTLMSYWAMAGIPLAALLFASITGSEAGKAAAAAAEQPMPVSQYRLLLSSLAAALIQSAALTLLVWTFLGFHPPLDHITDAQQEILRLYPFSLLYLAVSAFAFSYLCRNGIIGAMLAAIAVFFTSTPLTGMSLFTNMEFSVLPLNIIEPAILFLALGGTLYALKLLSGISDRKERSTFKKVSAIAVLLAAPPLLSMVCLVIFNITLQQIYFPLYRRDAQYKNLPGSSYLPGSPIEKESSRRLFAQRPFTGEVFLLDTAGRKTVILPGQEESRFPRTFSFFPTLYIPFNVNSMVTDSSGEIWIVLSKRSWTGILSGRPGTGFRLRTEIATGDWIDLIGGKKPMLYRRENDEQYVCALPPANGRLQWTKIAKHGINSVIREKYRKEAGYAELSDNLKVLIYGKKRWALPAAAFHPKLVPGFYLKDGIGFIVEYRKDGRKYSVLCRPDGKTTSLPLQFDYFNHPYGPQMAPDGTFWNRKLERAQLTWAAENKLRTEGGDARFAGATFDILTSEGRALRVKLDGVLRATRVNNGNIRLVHAKGDHLWFSVGNKFMAKTSAQDTENFRLWRLPQAPLQPRMESYGLLWDTISPATDGIFITGTKGVYFMDWEGRIRKLL
jgi:hypothetical protein